MQRLVLLVDDDPDVCAMVAVALTDAGYRVVTASNGAIALDLASRLSPALILLDLLMPTLDGVGFLEQYRQRPGPHAPIVVLTALDGTTVSGADLGVTAIATKPFDLDRLLEYVDYAVRADAPG